MTKREEYEHLLKRSKEFYLTATLQIEHGLFGLATFSLEQAVQLFLKAKLIMMGVDYPRTHSIRRLLELLAQVVDENSSRILSALVSKYSLELASLEDAYIMSRYFPREFRREDAERLKRIVDEVMSIVSRIIG